MEKSALIFGLLKTLIAQFVLEFAHTTKIFLNGLIALVLSLQIPG
jgi:hypothetical protein